MEGKRADRVRAVPAGLFGDTVCLTVLTTEACAWVCGWGQSKQVAVLE